MEIKREKQFNFQIRCGKEWKKEQRTNDLGLDLEGIVCVIINTGFIISALSGKMGRNSSLQRRQWIKKLELR